MKNLFLSLTILFFISPLLRAQETTESSSSEESWIAGSLELSSLDLGDSNTNFKIMPEFGSMINDRFGVGINLGYAKLGYDKVSLEEIRNPWQQYQFGAFARFIALQDKRGNLFIDGGVNFSFFTNEGNYGETITVNMFDFGFRPGATFSITEKFSLIVRFGFLGTRQLRAHGEDKNTWTGLDLDLDNCSLGIVFHL